MLLGVSFGKDMESVPVEPLFVLPVLPGSLDSKPQLRRRMLLRLSLFGKEAKPEL